MSDRRVPDRILLELALPVRYPRRTAMSSFAFSSSMTSSSGGISSVSFKKKRNPTSHNAAALICRCPHSGNMVKSLSDRIPWRMHPFELSEIPLPECSFAARFLYRFRIFPCSRAHSAFSALGLSRSSSWTCPEGNPVFPSSLQNPVSPPFCPTENAIGFGHGDHLLSKMNFASLSPEILTHTGFDKAVEQRRRDFHPGFQFRMRLGAQQSISARGLR